MQHPISEARKYIGAMRGNTQLYASAYFAHLRGAAVEPEKPQTLSNLNAADIRYQLREIAARI